MALDLLTWIETSWKVPGRPLRSWRHRAGAGAPQPATNTSEKPHMCKLRVLQVPQLSGEEPCLPPGHSQGSSAFEGLCDVGARPVLPLTGMAGS